MKLKHSTTKPTNLRFSNKPTLIKYLKDYGVMLHVLCDDGLPVQQQPTLQSYPLSAENEPGYSIYVTASATNKEQDDGITASRDGAVWVSQNLHDELQNELADEASEVRKLSSLPIHRAFVYVDVSEFSKFKPGQQALIVNSLVQLVKKEKFWRMHRDAEVEAMLCIGDGYIFVLKTALSAVKFAAGLARIIELEGATKKLPVNFHFRMGVHYGPVYCFYDEGRNDFNYIGDGINVGQRILAAIGEDVDDVIFISSEVKQELDSSPEASGDVQDILEALENKGRRKDKHGTMRRVYQVNYIKVADYAIILKNWKYKNIRHGIVTMGANEPPPTDD